MDVKCDVAHTVARMKNREGHDGSLVRELSGARTHRANEWSAAKGNRRQVGVDEGRCGARIWERCAELERSERVVIGWSRSLRDLVDVVGEALDPLRDQVESGLVECGGHVGSRLERGSAVLEVGAHVKEVAPQLLRIVLGLTVWARSVCSGDEVCLYVCGAKEWKAEGRLNFMG